MSASLVGSEMCIRDRGLSGPQSAPSRDPQCGRRTIAAGARTLNCVAQDSCLLYTSDAADDM
eukprot:14885588-Alexandrium_andersonii.AAC.1